MYYNFSASVHASQDRDAKPTLSVAPLENDGGTVLVELSPRKEGYSSLTMFIRGKAQLEQLRSSVAESLAKLDELIAKETLP